MKEVKKEKKLMNKIGRMPLSQLDVTMKAQIMESPKLLWHLTDNKYKMYKKCIYRGPLLLSS
jgi:uncharacterized Rmd1/YagE family protein